MEDMLLCLCLFVIFFSGKWSDCKNNSEKNQNISMTGVTIEQAIFQDEVSKVHFFGLCFNCQCSYLDKRRLKRLGAWIKSCGMSQWIMGWKGTTLSSVEPGE